MLLRQEAQRRISHSSIFRSMRGRSTLMATTPWRGTMPGAPARSRRRPRLRRMANELSLGAAELRRACVSSACVAREGRQRVLEAGQILRDGDADHVRARRQELADLDLGGPQLLQRLGERAAPGRPLGDRRQGVSRSTETGEARRPRACASGRPPGITTSCRTMTMPARARRIQSDEGFEHGAKPPSPLQRGNAAGIVAIGRPGRNPRPSPGCEVFLIRKPADRFDQILVARAVAGRRNFAQRRDHVEGIEIIRRLQHADGSGARIRGRRSARPASARGGIRAAPVSISTQLRMPKEMV